MSRRLLAGPPKPPASRRRGQPWLPPGERWLGVSPAQPEAPAALAFPGAYPAAMASLGYLSVLRELLAQGLPTHRLPLAGSAPPESLEEGRPLRSYRLVALSAAWELEAVEAVAALRRAGLEPDPARRGPDDPLVVAGGALTLVNPRPLLAFADAVVFGEGLTAATALARGVLRGAGRRELLDSLGALPNTALAGQPDDAVLAERHAAAVSRYTVAPGPLASPVVTEASAFGESFLVEACRGCPRGCRFCVLRRDRCGPFAPFAAETVVEAVPAGAPRAGLVGAGISDHPALERLLERLVDRGIAVSTSSLRVASLTEAHLRLLVRGGARQLTVGVDGLSERLRDALGKPLPVRRVEALAEAARAAGLEALKLYVMVGVPDETAEDVAEFVELARRAARHVRLAVSAAPLVPKPWTPLAEVPFAPATALRERLAGLRRGLGSFARLDLGSPRVAAREHALAHASLAEARRLTGVVR
ncbi:MAG: B12-binding domain-containing radical SAM protein [Deltaproteobacteria bacterium]|nr:B12-binding domain-containing radical SAM protein [Deltaproteobacteria bacterium]